MNLEPQQDLIELAPFNVLPDAERGTPLWLLWSGYASEGAFLATIWLKRSGEASRQAAIDWYFAEMLDLLGVVVRDTDTVKEAKVWFTKGFDFVIDCEISNEFCRLAAKHGVWLEPEEPLLH